MPLCRFVLGLALAVVAASLAKAVFALPRPFVVLGAAVYRAASAPDSRMGLLLFAGGPVSAHTGWWPESLQSVSHKRRWISLSNKFDIIYIV